MIGHRPTTPYIGPVPFDAADEDFFFGRVRETAEVTSLTLAGRVLLVYSRTRAGKTSLMNAGVIPSLKRHDVTGLGPKRLTSAATLSHLAYHGNVFLATFLAGWAAPSTGGAPAAPGSLRAFLAATRPFSAAASSNPPPFVIVLDQFEEVFTIRPERRADREDLFRQLGAALA